MYRVAIAIALLIAASGLIVFLVRKLMHAVDAETARTMDSGGPMPKVAFFLLLCVMAYAIATGAA